MGGGFSAERVGLEQTTVKLQVTCLERPCQRHSRGEGGQGRGSVVRGSFQGYRWEVQRGLGRALGIPAFAMLGWTQGPEHASNHLPLSYRALVFPDRRYLCGSG